MIIIVKHKNFIVELEEIAEERYKNNLEEFSREMEEINGRAPGQKNQDLIGLIGIVVSILLIHIIILG